MNRFIIILLTLSLLGCATTYDHGYGIVTAQTKLSEKDYMPHNSTRTGAIMGGGAGAVGGSLLAGLFSLGIGSAFAAGPALVATTAIGAVLGGVVVGSVGILTGGTFGYINDITKSNVGLYQFTVKPNDSSETIIIEQYTTPFSVNSQIQILEKDNVLFLKSKK